MLSRLISRLLTLLVALTALNQAKSVSNLPNVDWFHSIVLDDMGKFVASWLFDDNHITFELQVETRGYIGFGFSPNGGMKGADMIMGWIDPAGEIQFTDRYSTSNGVPLVDNVQDYDLLSGFSNDSHTVLRFRRPWNTCDSEQDIALSNDTTKIIWAYNDEQPDSPEGTPKYHYGKRGTKSFYLMQPIMPKPKVPEGTKILEIRSPSVHLPDNIDTIYWCSIHKIPKFDSKHHLIGAEPIIDKANLPFVHHMILYECSMDDEEKYLDKWVNKKGTQCYSRNMPESWYTCEVSLLGWGVGSEGTWLPQHVGFPTGEGKEGSTYYRLEVHYDNPSMLKGIVDNSGLRLYLTDKLRKYDAGVIAMGHAVRPTLVIPPNQIWSTIGHCSADCTQSTFPQEGIHVLVGLLHSHLLGKSISVQHIRDGKELEPLLQDQNYDFNYQENRVLKEERTLLPGDHFITTCVYDSRHLNRTTFGGLSTNEEMCLSFFTYYPKKPEIGSCLSGPDIQVITKSVGFEDVFVVDSLKPFLGISKPKDRNMEALNEIEDQKLEQMEEAEKAGETSMAFSFSPFLRGVLATKPDSFKGQSLYDRLTSRATWTDEITKKLQRSITEMRYVNRCRKADGNYDKNVPIYGEYPKYIPYVAPNQCTAR